MGRAVGADSFKKVVQGAGTAILPHVHPEFTGYHDGNYFVACVCRFWGSWCPSMVSQHLKLFDSSVPAVTWYFAHSSTGSHQRNQPVSSLPVVVWLMRRRNGQGNGANIIGFSVHGQIHQVFLMACHFKFIFLAQLEVCTLQYLFLRMYSSTACTDVSMRSGTANTQSNDVSLADSPRYYSRRWKLIEASKRLVRPIID